jgi:hypothetical protein
VLYRRRRSARRRIDNRDAAFPRAISCGYEADLKATVDGELAVAGPELAAAVAPLIDEYRLYFRPYVLGGRKPYFVGARPPLCLVATEGRGRFRGGQRAAVD